MSTEAGTEFRAVKEFRYDGKMYKRGDAWEPVGGKWDDQIIKAAFDNRINRSMRLVEPADPMMNPALRSKRNAKSASGTQKSVAVVEDRDAQAYRLYNTEGMTMEAVASELEVSAATVSRALKRHEKRLEGDE